MRIGLKNKIEDSMKYKRRPNHGAPIVKNEELIMMGKGLYVQANPLTNRLVLIIIDGILHRRRKDGGR